MKKSRTFAVLGDTAKRDRCRARPISDCQKNFALAKGPSDCLHDLSVVVDQPIAPKPKVTTSTAQTKRL